jgi:hypothetical protein
MAKPGLHVLREPECGLRERVEAITFLGREPHIDRLQVIFELRKPPRADHGREHPRLRLPSSNTPVSDSF